MGGEGCDNNILILLGNHVQLYVEKCVSQKVNLRRLRQDALWRKAHVQHVSKQKIGRQSGQPRLFPFFN